MSGYGFATTSGPILTGSGHATTSPSNGSPYDSLHPIKDLNNTSEVARRRVTQAVIDSAAHVPDPFSNKTKWFEQEAANSLMDQASDLLDDVLPNGADQLADSGISGQTFDYLDAELAKAYGMDRNTAYAEAMANSSYQRAVADMKKAGLNPALLFGSGSGSGSGSGYVSGRSSGYGESANNAKDELFSSSMYNGLSSIVGMITALVTKNPGNYYIGSNATKGVMSLMNGVYDSVND